MRSVLVTGATGTYGLPIADKLRESHTVYTLQRHPTHVDEQERWLDFDMMEPEQTITAVHHLWNEVNEKKCKPLSAIVNAAGSTGYDEWDNLTTFDFQAALRLHVIEPMMLIRYMIEYGVMAPDAKAFWLIDSRPIDKYSVAQRTAKAAMMPMIEAMGTQLPDTFESNFRICPDSNRMDATRHAAEWVDEALKG